MCVCVCTCICNRNPLKFLSHTHAQSSHPHRKFCLFLYRIFLHFFLNEMQKEDQSQCMRKGRGRGEGGTWQAAVSGENYANDWANYVQKYAFRCQLTCDLTSPSSPRSRPLTYFKTSRNNNIIIIEKFSSSDWVSPISTCCCPWQQISSIENFCK